MPCMDDIKRLADDIYRERIIRARQTSSAEKLMEGPRLFDAVCERMKAAYSGTGSGADEDEVQQLLLQHIRRLRNIEEHAGVYSAYEVLRCTGDSDYAGGDRGCCDRVGVSQDVSVSRRPFAA